MARRRFIIALGVGGISLGLWPPVRRLHLTDFTVNIGLEDHPGEWS